MSVPSHLLQSKGAYLLYLYNAPPYYHPTTYLGVFPYWWIKRFLILLLNTALLMAPWTGSKLLLLYTTVQWRTLYLRHIYMDDKFSEWCFSLSRRRDIGICNFETIVKLCLQSFVTCCAPISNARESPLSIFLPPECTVYLDLCCSQTFQPKYPEQLMKTNMQQTHNPWFCEVVLSRTGYIIWEPSTK